TYTYAYAASGNPAGYNIWAVRTTETLPDGSSDVVYSNAYGEVMLDAFTPRAAPAPGTPSTSTTAPAASSWRRRPQPSPVTTTARPTCWAAWPATTSTSATAPGWSAPGATPRRPRRPTPPPATWPASSSRVPSSAARRSPR